ncbi:hypothetical protein ACEQ8H_008524 [Pleosporales sp. CAS-2024a]
MQVISRIPQVSHHLPKQYTPQATLHRPKDLGPGLRRRNRSSVSTSQLLSAFSTPLHFSKLQASSVNILLSTVKTSHSISQLTHKASLVYAEAEVTSIAGDGEATELKLNVVVSAETDRHQELDKTELGKLSYSVIKSTSNPLIVKVTARLKAQRAERQKREEEAEAAKKTAAASKARTVLVRKLIALTTRAQPGLTILNHTRVQIQALRRVQAPSSQSGPADAHEMPSRAGFEFSVKMHASVTCRDLEDDQPPPLLT